jgi:transglutaminase-like putative cysteine protease
VQADPTQPALDALAAFFAKYPAAKPHTPTDPNKLPWGSPKPTTRKPAESKTELSRRLFGAPVQLTSTSTANLGPIQIAQASTSAAPTAADLAETEDVQITPAIRALAASLNHNPVEITNWVRNNIEWIPSYGSIQGAELTLQNKRGNAIDTASLTIALLRAASIPARYVIGTVEVDADKLNNWVGGTDTVEAAISLIGQGGIPNLAITAGGKIAKVRMEHAWVKAYVNWVPARGAKNYSATQHINANPSLNAWVDVDTSYKQYTSMPGMTIAANLPPDANALIDAVQQGATVDSAEGFVQNLNQANLQTQVSTYQASLRTYISNTKPNATVGDVIGARTVLQVAPSLLAGSLPYRIVSAGRTETSALTDSLRWHVDLSLYGSPLDRALDNPLMSRSVSLPVVAGKRLALTYEPATDADRALLEQAAENYQVRFTAYLVQMKATLRLDETVLAGAPGAQPGAQQELSVVMRGPGSPQDRTYKLTVGDATVLSVNPNGMTGSALEARQIAVPLADSVRAPKDAYRFVEEMLHQIGMAWWAEKFAYGDLIASQQGILHFNMPSHALVLAPISVSYFFGVPRTASYKSRAMDGKLDQVAVAHRAEDRAAERIFRRTAGSIGSYLEGAIFEQAFLAEQPYGVSTMSLLAAANQQGARIYSITNANSAAINQIATSSDVRADLANAVAAGLKVTVPDRDVEHFGYRGIGYILEDPETGAAAYQIDGGRSGGSSGANETIYPLPQVPASAAFGLIARSALRGTGMSLVAENGLVVGVTMPAVRVAAAAGAGVLVGGGPILIALLVLLILITAFIEWLDRTYPKTRWRLRHYTNAAVGIVFSGFITETVAGTFGNGVYAVDTIDEERRLAGCPPNSADVVTRLQIPRPGAEDPSLVTGYVDFAITRLNYFVVDAAVNGTGQREYIIREPLFSTIHPVKLMPTRALFLKGPWSFGIEIEDYCP